MTNAERLEAACQQVFEQIAYMLCEKPGDNNFSGDMRYLRGTIYYDGEKDGSLTLAGPEKFFRLAGRMALGDDEADLPAESTLKELLNVICGVYVHMENPSSDIRLAIPLCADMSQGEWSCFCQDNDTVVLMVESLPVAAKAGPGPGLA